MSSLGKSAVRPMAMMIMVKRNNMLMKSANKHFRQILKAGLLCTMVVDVGEGFRVPVSGRFYKME